MQQNKLCMIRNIYITGEYLLNLKEYSPKSDLPFLILLFLIVLPRALFRTQPKVYGGAF